MRGDISINNQTVHGVRLLTYNEEPVIGILYGTVGIVVEIHTGQVNEDGPEPLAILLSAGIRVVEDYFLIRGYQRTGRDRYDQDRYFKPGQAHESAVVRFYPYGTEDTKRWLERIQRGGTDDTR